MVDNIYKILGKRKREEESGLLERLNNAGTNPITLFFIGGKAKSQLTYLCGRNHLDPEDPFKHLVEAFNFLNDREKSHPYVICLQKCTTILTDLSKTIFEKGSESFCNFLDELENLLDIFEKDIYVRHKVKLNGSEERQYLSKCVALAEDTLVYLFGEKRIQFKTKYQVVNNPAREKNLKINIPNLVI